MAAVRGAGTVEENELSPKKQRKELRSYKKIPVWLCEYHQEVLPYIYRAIGSKFLPFSGITLLHFDSHPDLMTPLDMKAESVFDKELLFDVVSIADWILPAVYVGHIQKVIWIKPPWSVQISDKILCFNVGRHKVERTIRVSCCEKYFCEDGLYAPEVELENCKELVVVVKTMPVCGLCNMDGHDIDTYQEKQLNNACASSRADHSSKCHEEIKYDTDTAGKKTSSIKSLIQIDLDAKHASDDKRFESDLELFMNEVSSMLEEPYILDIDMDFFSTLNPFEAMFCKEEFQTLKEFYEFPQVKSNLECDMKVASEQHKKNVQRLERTLNVLKEGERDVPERKEQSSSVDVEFMEFMKKWRNARNEPIDYEMVHSAGMTTNLPVHITDENDIVQMAKSLERLLFSLPKPTMITVARSSDDDYTPPSSVEFIQCCLIACLENCYKKNIEFFYKYKDE